MLGGQSGGQSGPDLDFEAWKPVIAQLVEGGITPKMFASYLKDVNTEQSVCIQGTTQGGLTLAREATRTHDNVSAGSSPRSKY